ncbi:hypothetical protein B7494_g3712 [Chlorociboria aeruginascens]|nr:hypothetical protein B7494_g3712 [Chlorociboria aeruginascens]
MEIPELRQPPLETRVKYLFISRHVLGHFPTLQFLPAFYEQRLCNLALASAAKAVMFAYFAAEVSCSSVLQTARRAYSSALIETNKALQLPKNATNNCTLLIVILLDLIENFMPQEQTHVGNEAKHLQGAIVLLKLRGETQFLDPLSMELFHHLSSRVLYDCLKYGLEVPGDFVSLRNQAWIFADDTDQKWRLCEVMFQLIALQAGLKQRLISRPEVMESIRQLRNDSLHLQKAFILERADVMADGTAETHAGFGIRRDLHFRLIQNVLDEITQVCSIKPTGWDILQ